MLRSNCHVDANSQKTPGVIAKLQNHLQKFGRFCVYYGKYVSAPVEERGSVEP